MYVDSRLPLFPSLYERREKSPAFIFGGARRKGAKQGMRKVKRGGAGRHTDLSRCMHEMLDCNQKLHTSYSKKGGEERKNEWENEGSTASRGRKRVKPGLFGGRCGRKNCHHCRCSNKYLAQVKRRWSHRSDTHPARVAAAKETDENKVRQLLKINHCAGSGSRDRDNRQARPSFPH